jgi:hypothetical protein
MAAKVAAASKAKIGLVERSVGFDKRVDDTYQRTP